MNRKISLGVSIALVFLAITVTFSVTMMFSMRLFNEKVLSVKERAAMYDKLTEIDGVVRSNLYYDIDEQKLCDAIAMGYLDGVGDRDSIYLSPAQIQRRNEMSKGNEVTIGFETEKSINGYMLVTSIRRGCSAAELGLVEGDIIVRVEELDILENGYDESAALLDGAAGTKVTLTYTRDGEETTIEVTREKIETAVVFASREIKDIGYLRIKLFNDNTEKQFNAMLGELVVRNPVKGLIIDLRDTDGGYNLETVANMLDRLLPTGVLISGTFSNNVTKILYTSDDTGVKIPIVVLVNENTYGFAELFAGVIGDYEKTAIVGTQTYGKGTLQQLCMLTDGSALDLTVAVLNLPASGTYDGVGIRPDYEAEDSKYMFSDGEPDPVQDAQLAKAVEVLYSMLK